MKQNVSEWVAALKPTKENCSALVLPETIRGSSLILQHGCTVTEFEITIPADLLSQFGLL
jgi:hypothetical protein